MTSPTTEITDVTAAARQLADRIAPAVGAFQELLVVLADAYVDQIPDSAVRALIKDRRDQVHEVVQSLRAEAHEVAIAAGRPG